MSYSWSSSLRSSQQVRLSATVDLGVDRGHPLGTIAVLRRISGEAVVGLGFPQVMNHFCRTNHRQLGGFARSSAALAPISSVLGTAIKPRYRTAVLDGELIDLTNCERFNTEAAEWEALPLGWAGVTLRSGEKFYSVQRIGAAIFAVTTQRVVCDGATIYELNTPAWGGCAFWHDGWLHVCCPGYREIRTFSWRPGDGPVGSPSTIHVIGPHYGRAFAVLGSAVIMATHAGGLHRFSGGSWSAVQWSFPGEFYAIAQIGETLRIGDYGSGVQWLYDPTQTPALQKMTDNPATEPGAHSEGREVQSFAIAGGALFHGLYPWGVVHWRDLLNWTWGQRRMNTAPAVTSMFCPFQAELAALGVDANVFPGLSRWGQRITALTPWRDGIVVSCTNMPGDLVVPPGQAGLMANGVLEQYGRTHFLRLPHACAGEIAWKAEPTVLELEIAESGVMLRQDGSVIATGSGLAPSALASGDIVLDVGRGIYGSFGGASIVSVTVKPG